MVLLDRGSPQLLLLTTTFLRRLSLFAENSRALRESEVVGQLTGMLPGDGGMLLTSVLRLLHNLSFDEGMRAQMVAAGLITKAADLLKAGTLRSSSGSANGGSLGAAGPAWQQQLQQRQQQQQQGGQGAASEGQPVRQLVLGILYHLSLQDKHRSMFLYTGK